MNISRYHVKSLICAIGIISGTLSQTACNQVAECGVAVPNEHQMRWADAEIGVIFHLDMQVFCPEYDWREWGTHPDASVFNPIDLNTDQWIETAQKMGAKYAILVAKHGTGFSLWPTKAHDYNITNSPWKDGKGDVVADFVASCKKYGLKPGIYANTNANGYLHADYPGLVSPNAPVSQEEYNQIVNQQLSELWSNYGDLFEIWFDGGVLTQKKGGPDVLSLVKRLQPAAIAFQGPYGHPNLIRWVGNEEGVAPYPCWATADSTTSANGTTVIDGLTGNPDAPFWCPGESDFTLRHNDTFQAGWMWKEGEGHRMFTVDELVRKYETSVGRNTNMLIGLVINDRGLVPEADSIRAEELGLEIIRLYGSPLNETAGEGSELLLDLDGEHVIDRLVMQENIKFGERVREYRLQGKSNGKWIDLASGSCIGHKRIERIEPVKVNAIRLKVTDSRGVPQIRKLAVYEALNGV